MKIGIQNFYEIFNKNNSLFKPDIYPIGENLEYPFVCLKNELQKRGHSLDTLDIYPLDQYDKVIFLDMPAKTDRRLLDLIRMKTDLYLIVLESPIVRPENWDTTFHMNFRKIFTWNDSWADNTKYFKINIAQKIPKKLSFHPFYDRRFCTIIAGNKKLVHPDELYSERLNCIRWFDSNQPAMLDLYGTGWDRRTFAIDCITRVFNKIGIMRDLFYKAPKSYKGRILSKSQILANYKFSFCYENAKGAPGYITEKIFDSLFAGCVPIYLGAPNVSEYIPDGCFVDKKSFPSYDSVYKFLKDMSESRYNEYLKNIETFINSEQIWQFSGEYFADRIACHIFSD